MPQKLDPHHKTILVIDDEPDIVEILTSYLEDEGHRVEVAYDGHEGLGRARALKPDLIILDFMLPMKHGLTFCKEIKGEAALASIPILLLTGTGKAETVGAAHETGDDPLCTSLLRYDLGLFENDVLLSIGSRSRSQA